MFLGGDASRFVALRSLVPIEGKSEFNLARNTVDSYRKLMGFHTRYFYRQWARRQGLIDRRCAELEHRCDLQHNRDQSHKTQHAQAEAADQSKCNGRT